MRTIFFLLILLSPAVIAKAQSRLSCAVGAEAGLLRGDKDKSSYFLVNYGVRHKNTTVGIGGGLDGYLFRSVPFYAIIKQEIGHRKLKPFADLSAGINFNNATDAQIQAYRWGQDTEYKNGFFFKSSAGLSVCLHHFFRVYLSAGYSYKTTDIIYNKYISSPGLPPNQNEDIFHMQRWCFATGFWF